MWKRFGYGPAVCGVSDVSAKVSEAAQDELKSQVTAVTERNLRAHRISSRLANGGFEPLGSNPLGGWHFAKGPGQTADLDATNPHGGKTSLFLSSGGQFATVESELMPTSPTGQLFLTAWLRGENLSPNTELRMVLQTEGGETSYRNSAAVGPRQAGQPLGNQWQHNGFWVQDLPLDSQGKMRVKFELDGAGEVWIDDVVLYELLFPFSDHEYENSTAEKTKLLLLRNALQTSLADGQVAACAHLLDNYWLRFLTAYTPRAELQPAVAQQATVTQPNAAPPAKPAEPPAETKTGWRQLWPWR